MEERKSLEILLKDKPLNVLKLKQFCIRFTVPNIHRSVLWNFLLGEYLNFIISDWDDWKELSTIGSFLFKVSLRPIPIPANM